LEQPDDIAGLPHPRLGYFGAIEPWLLDQELIRYVIRGLSPFYQRDNSLTHFLGASVPRRLFYRLLASLALLCRVVCKRILRLRDEVIIAARNAKYTIQRFVFVNRGDH